jgi:hypothetical protein
MNSFSPSRSEVIASFSLHVSVTSVQDVLAQVLTSELKTVKQEYDGGAIESRLPLTFSLKVARDTQKLFP